MARMGRPGLSSAQKAELWQRWKSGQSLSDIGRALGKHAGSVHGVLSANGGILSATRFYNRIRRHAKIGNQIPADFASQYYISNQIEA
jgi:transposase InsO family protein